MVVNRGKTLQFLTVVTFCLLAILAGLNSTAVMSLVWHYWYGNHMTWNGIDVEINHHEYFLPTKGGESALFIGDWKSQDANIIIHKGNRTTEHQKAFVADFCRPGECRGTSEKTYDINGRRVTSFTFVKPNTNGGIFHEYLVIDGSDAWIEFFGNEASYPEHKPTLDSIVKELTNTLSMVKS